MIPNTVRIFVCTSPVDMRYGFDRLAQTVRAVMGENRIAPRGSASVFGRLGYGSG